MVKSIFGPVPSRRLGLSLGIDLVPYKTCSFDCVYCECGHTTELLSERQIFIPTKTIIKEFTDFIIHNPVLDYITFSGSGEPTLAKNIGEIISFLKHSYPHYPLALLSNSSLLSDLTLQEELLPLDTIIPSLDAATQPIFNKINLPAKDLKITDIIEGLYSFRRKFKNRFILEIFIIPGLNDTTKELNALKKAILQISPDLIQLNTLDRPGSESWVKAASYSQLQSIASLFSTIPVEIAIKPSPEGKTKKLNTHSSPKTTLTGKSVFGRILDTLKRRPCTANDLSEMLNLKESEISKYLYVLEQENKIIRTQQKRGTFFKSVD